MIKVVFASDGAFVLSFSVVFYFEMDHYQFESD